MGEGVAAVAQRGAWQREAGEGELAGGRQQL